MPTPDLRTTRNAGIDPSVLYFADAGHDSIGQNIGRGIYAGREFKAGTKVFAKDRPLAAALNAQQRKGTCASCYAWNHDHSATSGSRNDKNLQKCAGCRIFLYCDRRCQSAHWKRIHKFQCKALKAMQEQLPSSAIEVALRVTLQVTMEILTRRIHGKVPDHQWHLLCSLPSHENELNKSEMVSPMSDILAARFRFAELNSYPADFIFEMYARVQTNSLTLVTPTFDITGMWIDEIISQVNHSCDPNAYIVMDGATLSLRSLKPIRKDEQICISYIEPTEPFFRRQKQLKEKWYFTCRCTKCERGDDLVEDSWVSTQGLPSECKEKATALLEEKFGNQVNMAKFSDENLKSILQEKAWELYDTRPRTDLKEEMDFFYQSEVWPIYRQPYAALRDDLIINLCAMGRHKEAWEHCGDRYWRIWPQLYEEKAHPNRIVQLFFTARLASYLAAEGHNPGVDMGLMALALMRETKELVLITYGRGMTFTQAVLDEYNTIWPQGDTFPRPLEEQLTQEKTKWMSLVRQRSSGQQLSLGGTNSPDER